MTRFVTGFKLWLWHGVTSSCIIEETFTGRLWRSHSYKTVNTCKSTQDLSLNIVGGIKQQEKIEKLQTNWINLLGLNVKMSRLVAVSATKQYKHFH